MVTVILSEKELLNLPPKTKKGRNQRKENLQLPQCQMTLKRNLILRYKYLSEFCVVHYVQYEQCCTALWAQSH